MDKFHLKWDSPAHMKAEAQSKCKSKRLFLSARIRCHSQRGMPKVSLNKIFSFDWAFCFSNRLVLQPPADPTKLRADSSRRGAERESQRAAVRLLFYLAEENELPLQALLCQNSPGASPPSTPTTSDLMQTSFPLDEKDLFPFLIVLQMFIRVNICVQHAREHRQITAKSSCAVFCWTTNPDLHHP